MVAYEKEQQIAIAAVTVAAGLCQRVRQLENWATLTKADTSPVTIADFATQAVICQALSVAFPDDPIIGEEDAALLVLPELAEALGQITHQVQTILPEASSQQVIDSINRGKGKIASRYWTLDPIDGTKGFIRGDQYAIALALVEAGEVKLGILGCPALPVDFNDPQGDLGVIFLGIRGQGSQMRSIDGKKSHPITVNRTDEPGNIQRIESVEYTHSDRTRQKALDQTLGVKHPVKQMDSLAKYGAIARGEADLYVRIPLQQPTPRYENIWDHASGVVIVEEAGGKVTDLDGKALDFSVGPKLSNNRGIVVTNGKIHQQVLETIAQTT
ncbi:3'(2'),5'-bisphosphate nucleotidase [Gloeothece citriformis PCC 7424]|uniref:3'(2'),5'-bisphosphate nucleotidase n=1 Tax=Gloeothece citriformis (strain PCC 7424) TaxID=65393 RepID=B7KCZ2_GLOC7|nr:3'(2'),5'-bisphosphate nucleotidase [Gloeothece citriformis]ACK73113.1 3'(2'),5'-bisphosphate nucleotidase [Gloeothece citriformis PCC 7424]